MIIMVVVMGRGSDGEWDGDVNGCDGAWWPWIVMVTRGDNEK